MELWIYDMARALVYEVTEQMAGIILTGIDAFDGAAPPEEQVVMYGLIQGDYEIHVQLLAEWKLLYRLAYCMMEQEPEQDDVREYALEYFNTICGRFISEIINQTHISVKLVPVRYELSSKSPLVQPGEKVSELYFLSDQQEQVVFSWTSMPIKNMRRSGKNE